MNKENYDAALAGLMSSLDALNRAKSFGGFVHPTPESNAIGVADKALQDAIALLLTRRREKSASGEAK